MIVGIPFLILLLFKLPWENKAELRFTEDYSEAKRLSPKGFFIFYYIDLIYKINSLNYSEIFNSVEFKDTIFADILLQNATVYLKISYAKCDSYSLGKTLAYIMSSHKKNDEKSRKVVMVNNCDMSCSVVRQLDSVFFGLQLFVTMCKRTDSHINTKNQIETTNQYFPVLYKLTKLFLEAFTYLNLTCVNIVTTPEVSIEEIFSYHMNKFKKHFNGCVTYEIYLYDNQGMDEENTFSFGPTLYFFLMSVSDVIKYFKHRTNKFFDLKKIPIVLLGHESFHDVGQMKEFSQLIEKKKRIILIKTARETYFHANIKTHNVTTYSPIYSFGMIISNIRRYIELLHQTHHKEHSYKNFSKFWSVNQTSVHFVLRTEMNSTGNKMQTTLYKLYLTNRTIILSHPDSDFLNEWKKYPEWKLDPCGLDGTLCKTHKLRLLGVLELRGVLLLLFTLVGSVFFSSFKVVYKSYCKLKTGVNEWIIIPEDPSHESAVNRKYMFKGHLAQKLHFSEETQNLPSLSISNREEEVETINVNRSNQFENRDRDTDSATKRNNRFKKKKKLNSITKSKMSFLKHLNLNRKSTEMFDGQKKNHAIYEEKEVYVTNLPLRKIKDNVFNTTLVRELDKMKSLNHENLLNFFGVRLDSRQIYMLAAKHGSLRDIIQDKCLKQVFNLNLMVSLLIDIAKGMDYLHHSKIGSHGHLRSSKCVIDDRWHCKITGYGLSELRVSRNEAPIKREEDMLYISPELLRIPIHYRSFYGSRTGDVYSFAMILQEVILMDVPYAQEIHAQKMTIPEILANVRSRKLDPPFRPYLGEEQPLEWRMLVGACWEENPKKRFTFHEIMSILWKLVGNEQVTFAEALSQRLEQNVNNLGAMVNELTADVQKESEKAYNLLSCVLPKNVADDYIMGKLYEPQEFESATLLCTDMKGFTKLSASCSPREAIEFLNSLYSIYDDIVKSRDAYKLETIGDAYIVISGCPVSNGNKHASEIAIVALQLIATASGPTAPLMAGVRVGTRAGIHSGPVIAGVVGIKVPKFCVFGPMYFIATQMEIASMVNRIKISEDTYALLDSNVFECQPSYSVSLPNGNEIGTYMLDQGSF